jgi:hypothetical protein
VNTRENVLRAVRFEHPESIPVTFGISPGCWNYYEQDALQELMAEHKLLFPDFRPSKEKIVPANPPWRTAGNSYADSWGCVWETAEDGIIGAVIKHPLTDWSDFQNYVAPSPENANGWKHVDWNEIAGNISKARSEGKLAKGELRHGHTFLTLTYLRGYENLLFDMMDEEPKLRELISLVEDFNLGIVRNYLKTGVELFEYPEDLGMQVGPMLTPDQFRQYIKPSYKKLIAPAQEAGCVIHMHSDGDIRDLYEDLLDLGIEALNIQDIVNGVEWMQKNLKGKVCIDLDIDRQDITFNGTPEQIDEHIRNAVNMLGSKSGGLMLRYGLYPGVPLENAKAIMDALERYSQ